MKTFALVFVFLILAAVCTDANPIMKDSVAKQLFRSKRQYNPYEWIQKDLLLRQWEWDPVPVVV